MHFNPLSAERGIWLNNCLFAPSLRVGISVTSVLSTADFPRLQIHLLYGHIVSDLSPYPESPSPRLEQHIPVHVRNGVLIFCEASDYKTFERFSFPLTTATLGQLWFNLQNQLTFFFSSPCADAPLNIQLCLVLGA